MYVRRGEKIVIYLFTLSRTFDDVTWNSVLSPGPPLCPSAFCSLGRLFFLGVFIVVGQSRRGIWPQPTAPDRKSSVLRVSAKIGCLLCDRWHWHPPTHYSHRLCFEFPVWNWPTDIPVGFNKTKRDKYFLLCFFARAKVCVQNNSPAKHWTTQNHIESRSKIIYSVLVPV